MKVRAIRTNIFQFGDDLFSFIKEQVGSLEEETVVVVTSKIISFAQQRTADIQQGTRSEKQQLARNEADLYLEPKLSKYGVMLTIKNSLLAVNAGIDESNSAGKYILWPANLQQVTNELWQYLRAEFKVKKLGVVVTDSKTMPLRWGVTGTAIAHCGFKALIDKRGGKDIFGKKLEMTQIQVAEAVAIAGVFEMGEGNEQRPLAVVTDFHQPIVWQDRPPTAQELQELVIELADDVYAPVLMNADWKKGGSK